MSTDNQPTNQGDPMIQTTIDRDTLDNLMMSVGIAERHLRFN